MKQWMRAMAFILAKCAHTEICTGSMSCGQPVAVLWLNVGVWCSGLKFWWELTPCSQSGEPAFLHLELMVSPDSPPLPMPSWGGGKWPLLPLLGVIWAGGPQGGAGHHRAPGWCKKESSISRYRSVARLYITMAFWDYLWDIRGISMLASHLDVTWHPWEPQFSTSLTIWSFLPSKQQMPSLHFLKVVRKMVQIQDSPCNSKRRIYEVLHFENIQNFFLEWEHLKESFK
jgi:hypothetical protein